MTIAFAKEKRRKNKEDMDALRERILTVAFCIHYSFFFIL